MKIRVHRIHAAAVAVLLMTMTGQGPCRAAEAATDSLRAPGPSLRTNLVWLAASEPNLGLEIPLSRRFTIGANAGLKPWPRFLPWDMEMVENTRHWRNFAIVPEFRFGDQVEPWIQGSGPGRPAQDHQVQGQSGRVDHPQRFCGRRECCSQLERRLFR